jgi:hypothetical protein
MGEQNIGVAVHLEDGIFSGNLVLPDTSRLSDFLNLPAKFLRLTHGSVSSLAGTVKEVAEIFINKTSIQLLRTVLKDDGRGMGKEKKYPYVVKTRARAQIYITGYEITGNLHCRTLGAVAPLLEQEQPFLPCTEATIRDVRTDKTWEAGFAAVNRTHIYALEKVMGPP